MLQVVPLAIAITTLGMLEERVETRDVLLVIHFLHPCIPKSASPAGEGGDPFPG